MQPRAHSATFCCLSGEHLPHSCSDCWRLSCVAPDCGCIIPANRKATRTRGRDTTSGRCCFRCVAPGVMTASDCHWNSLYRFMSTSTVPTAGPTAVPWKKSARLLYGTLSKVEAARVLHSQHQVRQIAKQLGNLWHACALRINAPPLQESRRFARGRRGGGSRGGGLAACPCHTPRRDAARVDRVRDESPQAQVVARTLGKRQYERRLYIQLSELQAAPWQATQACHLHRDPVQRGCRPLDGIAVPSGALW